jgi:gas vesicle protein
LFWHKAGNTAYQYFLTNILKQTIMNTTGKIITAALAGAAVGAVAALLLAPASGKETREKLKDSLASAKDKVSNLISKGKEAATDLLAEGKETAKEFKNETKRASGSTL